ncbi:MAG: hypothetical protein EAZ08_10455 [Cytophagales bacterium]|nr:MAG: hypothetical protein EAZ08_10455 [Cytophagales bacterium]
MGFKYSFLSALFIVFLYWGCAKAPVEPEIDANKSGSIVLSFDNIAGTKDLKFGDSYTNAAGEQFSLDIFQYYISNIILKNEDGTNYIIPQDESYFLVKEEDAKSQIIKLKNIPEGNYSAVTFTIGVDSLRNTSDISKRIGVLDIGSPDIAMYWSWNSGYIFVKAEGLSPQVAIGPDGQRRFRYHIGGFGGYSSKTINNIKTTTISLGSDRATVRKDKITPEIYLTADVLKMFEGNTNISLAANPTVMFAAFSTNVAANYLNMFAYNRVYNEMTDK